MLDCRYYDLCYLTDDSCNGEPECPKREHCQFYSPMPEVKTLLELVRMFERDAFIGVQFPLNESTANETLYTRKNVMSHIRCIREALGEVG